MTHFFIASLGFCMFCLAAPGAKKTDAKDNCLFPGDCLTHTRGLNYGKCISESERREQLENYSSPAELRTMTKRWGESIRHRIFRVYELNDRQKEKVGKVLDAVFHEHRIAMGGDFERMKGFRANVIGIMQKDIEKVGAQLVENRKENPKRLPLPPPLWNDEEFLSIQKNMQQIEKRHPLDWNKMLTRVEKLLPDEQAKKGREGMRKDVPLWVSKASPDVTKDGKTDQKKQFRAVHPWERFVRLFIREHELTKAQAAAAMSILKEVLKRAAYIEKSEANVTDAPCTTSKDKRFRNSAEMRSKNQIEKLFEELKTRLNQLLTTSQNHNQKQAIPPKEIITPARQ